MSNESSHTLEVKQELVRIGMLAADSQLISYEQIVGGGSDCHIYELCFENSSIKFIQKVFTSNSDNPYAEFEYSNHKILFENNINVPQPYLLKLTPNTRDRPYFVMEKVEGPRLVEVKGNYPEQYEHLIRKLLQDLYKIHSLDPQLFPKIPLPNIQENPFAPIDRKLERSKKHLDKYPKDLKELIPVHEWLEKNKTNYPCEHLAVVHGDYHSFNILVTEDKDFKILDWNDVVISDFRMDVAYTATSESYTSKTQSSENRMKRANQIVGVYEEISKNKVEGLPYFMVLNSTFNLIRLYSMINNTSITGENEETKKFFISVYDYFLFLADIIEINCNVELTQLRIFQ
ncbi:MAG: phosphotransferase [Candidatus Heimdallarchaeota archaeon]|nr:phosphotransferase [Candidatus Heimdallarchaeota archaeon]